MLCREKTPYPILTFTPIAMPLRKTAGWCWRTWYSWHSGGSLSRSSTTRRPKVMRSILPLVPIRISSSYRSAGAWEGMSGRGDGSFRRFLMGWRNLGCKSRGSLPHTRKKSSRMSRREGSSTSFPPVCGCCRDMVSSKETENCGFCGNPTRYLKPSKHDRNALFHRFLWKMWTFFPVPIILFTCYRASCHHILQRLSLSDIAHWYCRGLEFTLTLLQGCTDNTV